MRVAAIDCGTNSIRLLIADGAPEEKPRDIVREMRIVRLGQDVDRTGRLAAEALERTRLALVEYAQEIAAHRVERVRMVATSATRDAANRDEFMTLVRAELGTEAEVISGSEEAQLSFRGAASGLPDLDQPVLLIDIGGGSTELVLGAESGALRSHSMDVGSVRMTERHLHGDPPTEPQVVAAVADVRAAIDVATTTVPLRDAATVVGVAGTITTIAAMVLRLDRYDPGATHGASITAADIASVTHRLLTMSRAERAAVAVIHPGRVDVIGGGAVVLDTVMRAAAADVLVVSEHDILDGIALSVLD